jgi:hypothetical protein
MWTQPSFRDIGLQRPGQQLTMYNDREMEYNISQRIYNCIYRAILYIRAHSYMSGDDMRA